MAEEEGIEDADQDEMDDLAAAVSGGDDGGEEGLDPLAEEMLKMMEEEGGSEEGGGAEDVDVSRRRPRAHVPIVWPKPDEPKRELDDIDRAAAREGSAVNRHRTMSSGASPVDSHKRRERRRRRRMGPR